MYGVRVRRRVYFSRHCLVSRGLGILFGGLGYRG